MLGFELDLIVRLVTPGKNGFLVLLLSIVLLLSEFIEDIVALWFFITVTPGFLTPLSMPLSSLICTFF